MERVQLQTAFSWRCPECQKRNFAAAVARELTEDEREALVEAYGPLEEADFDLVGAPRIVTCSKCGEKFDTYDEEDAKE
jgi:hypothetical protein